MALSNGRSTFSRVTDVFRVDGICCWPIVIAFIAIQLIVLYNAIVHDPRYGYDAPGHNAYVRTLAEGRLPTPTDSHEFFSPPLPYLPAALAWRIVDGSLNDTRQIIALKAAQFAQVIASLIVCWSVLAIARLLSSTREGPAVSFRAAASDETGVESNFTARAHWLGLVSLVCLGIVPAYYRTFAMVRGEPLMVALLLLGTYFVLRCYAVGRPSYRVAIVAGILLGGAILSRQWAFFALPALGLVGFWRLWVDVEGRRKTILTGLALLSSTALSGGWFYAHLRNEHGSIRAFNRPPEEEEVATTQAAASELLLAMRNAPVRNAFDGHPFWLFYADTWGDYWNYFLTYARDGKGRLVKAVLIERTVASGKSKGSNAGSMPAYLGRASTLAAVPTLVLIAGVTYGLWNLRRWPRRLEDAGRILLPTLTLGVLFTLAGYSWFVATYPNVRLDTVKASYPLQIFPLIAILTGAMWCALRERWPQVAGVIGVLVLVVFVHNAGTLLTRYTLF